MISGFFTLQHHGYVLQGDREVALSEIRRIVKKELSLETGDPDYLELSFETVGVEDSRKISDLQERMPLGEYRVFIVSFSFMTREAQNVLLKTLEEPTASTFLFFIVPASDMLLPTLRSRLIIGRLSSDSFVTRKEARDFLESSIDERLAYVSQFSEKENESRKSEFLSFVGELERELHDHLIQKPNAEKAAALHELLQFKKYLFYQAPSLKMIGEYLALRLPLIPSLK